MMKTTTRSWVVVLATSLFFFYVFIQMNLFNAINEQITQDFAFSAEQISQLFSSYFWGNLFFVFPAGIALDRFSPKKLVISAFLSAVILTYLFSIASNFQFLWFTRLLIGVCGSFCFLSAVKVTSLWFEPKNTGFVVSMFVALATLGGVIAQTPLSLLTLKIGWRAAMKLVAFFGCFLVLLQFIFVKDKVVEHREDHNKDQNNFFQSLKAVLLNPQNWLAGSFISLLNFPSYVFGGSWGVPFLKQVHHFSIGHATLITSMIFIGMIIGSPFAGYYSDKINLRRKPMLIGALGTIITLVAIMYLPSYSLLVAALLFLGLGFIMGFQVVGYPVITESNPITVTATASSISSILIMGAGTLVAWYGKLLDLGNNTLNGQMIYSKIDFLRANWFVLAGVIIALIAAFLTKETFGKLYQSNVK